MYPFSLKTNIACKNVILYMCICWKFWYGWIYQIWLIGMPLFSVTAQVDHKTVNLKVFEVDY